MNFDGSTRSKVWPQGPLRSPVGRTESLREPKDGSADGGRIGVRPVAEEGSDVFRSASTPNIQGKSTKMMG